MPFVNLKRVPKNNLYCPVCRKENRKMAETCDAKNKKRKTDIYENIVVFIELKCLHKCSQLYE